MYLNVFVYAINMEPRNALLQYIDSISLSRQAILSALSILSQQEITMTRLMNDSINNRAIPATNTILQTTFSAIETLPPDQQHIIQTGALSELLSRAMSRLANRAHPLTNELLTTAQITDATETMLFSELVGHSNIDIYQTCPISYERFVSESEITRLRYCGHYFGRDSIMRWLSINAHCPMCRHDLRINQTEDSSQTPMEDNDSPLPESETGATVSEEIDQSLNNILDMLFDDLRNANGQEHIGSVVFEIDIEPTPDVE